MRITGALRRSDTFVDSPDFDNDHCRTFALVIEPRWLTYVSVKLMQAFSR